ncbi:MAG: cytochrome c maturation protein CcmE [Alphaproteobacteria bacterium]|nr:cytochrome c maturation protein CcmE [Alphaproteobacteria bacterium]
MVNVPNEFQDLGRRSSVEDRSVHKKGQRRAWLILVVFLLASGVALMILGALRENVVFFVTPSEWVQNKKNPKHIHKKFLRLGGKVAPDSINRRGKVLYFTITDGITFVQACYQGLVPDLFREGQGVVAEGHFEANHDLGDDLFVAQRIFAKHDETYKPHP